jgi:hypothetical protein
MGLQESVRREGWKRDGGGGHGVQVQAEIRLSCAPIDGLNALQR